LANHVVTFTPTSALRSDSYRDARSTKATVIIDYEMLASASLDNAAPPSRLAPLNTGAEPARAPSAPSWRDAEIEDLRQELREIKKKLAEQDAERNKTPVAPR